ncbi:unnamed protein product [Gulo gulo]|uniref:Uncharacterized protein n=1 Tax=Gulo gulo TaxID=48420 RepID=A0A9X9Q2C4_GULGU|nr:unnamed protein product [Gulo gulo]
MLTTKLQRSKRDRWPNVRVGRGHSQGGSGFRWVFTLPDPGPPSHSVLLCWGWALQTPFPVSPAGWLGLGEEAMNGT